MSATGIGASVKRKEDIRFITGKGHYVDDINRHGQAYAYFLSSPHAHATIDKIDFAEASAMPGVVAIFTGEDIAKDKVGGLICGWMIHSKDGSPMKAGAHPALAHRKGALCRRPCRRRDRRHLRPGARRRREDRGRLWRAAGRDRYGDGGRARRGANPRRRPQQHDLRLAPRRQGGDRGGFRRRGARHQARPRQQSADPQSRWSPARRSESTIPEPTP